MAKVESTTLVSATDTPTHDSAGSGASSNTSIQTSNLDTIQPVAAAFPPPKTDKPRPHICTTCTRCFARLEHLKRHERSHTKEKPFECPQCTRCFARRDLLLRHQQKLHQQGATTTTRPRNTRRESTAGLPPNPSGRVRKNSVSSNAGFSGHPAMRPRANTISHIDPTALNSFLTNHSVSLGRGPLGHTGHSHHASLSGIGGASQFDYRGMSTAIGNHGPHGLPKLDTHGSMDLGGGLRTAPVHGVSSDELELEKFFGTASASTIDPNQLHHFTSTMVNPQSPFRQFVNPFAGNNPMEEDDFAWSVGLDNPMVFPGVNEPMVDGSSPSAISTASQGGFNEVMLDGSCHPTSSAMWHDQLALRSNINVTTFTMDSMAPVFPELNLNSVVPHDFGDHSVQTEFYLPSPPPLSVMNPSMGIPGMPNQYFQAPMAFSSDTGSISSSSMNGSGRHSSVTSLSTDSITECTRQALLYHLLLAMGHSHPQQKYSQPQISSPLSTSGSVKNVVQSTILPSTMDIQRYVNAYIQYFHPHLPFLHIPTLSFDTPAYTYHLRAAGNFNQDGIVGGGGCLILAMAAIGALYEFDHTIAKDLFEAAKKMILYYLDERRRAGQSAAAVSGASVTNDTINKPPLWLVQAMLLNLIFGHNCGDRQAAEVASTHCAALVSLARAAGLDKPATLDSMVHTSLNHAHSDDVNMADDANPSRKEQDDSVDEHSRWVQWKKMEECKRTYFAVFSMSSLLVSAYAHAPRILNSEIRLDLPCEEDLWSAETPQAWMAMGGPMISQARGLSFNAAMTYLLDASTRQANSQMHGAYAQTFGASQPPNEARESDLRPSTFGCYVLINALHVYIWETRQRHTGRLWKSHETEAMHAQVEPALKAWQAAWRANPNHHLECPSPFGPLSTDSIPLLDLAYVRLFVNLSRAKELLWQRDFDGMADELAKGIDLVGQAEATPERSSPMDPNSMSPGHLGQHDNNLINHISRDHTNQSQSSHATKRERHLRKAAFYAADCLSMKGRLGAIYTNLTARDLPSSSAMCTFDCAQVLAEWIATIQDRVGRFLGMLGKDEIDFHAVPAIMILEDEDVQLLQKIEDILLYADMKLAYDISSNSLPMLGGLSSFSHCGYGTKLLMVTALMLSKAAVWPVTHVQVRALESHANYINQRAEKSLSSP